MTLSMSLRKTMENDMFKRDLLTKLFLASAVFLMSLAAPAADLKKLDPHLRAQYEFALADGTDLGTIQVHFMAALKSSRTEAEVRDIFEKHGLIAGAVIAGPTTIATARGSLAALLDLTDEESLYYVEGSRVLGPEVPSVSIGN
jgi:hypothetical protein